jgi:hypothetical protein
MKILVVVSTVAALILLPYVVNAAVFLGARVTDRDVPMSAWKEGVLGLRPTIHEVPLNSIAEEAGLKNGDVIVSVNGTGVKTSLELQKFSKGDLSVVVFRWGERKTLTISKSAFEPKVPKKVQPEEDPAISAARKSRSVRERPDTSPPIVFNDETLEMRYGRSTPAPSAKSGVSDTKMGKGGGQEGNSSGLYAGKSLWEWNNEYDALLKEVNDPYSKIKRYQTLRIYVRSGSRNLMTEKEPNLTVPEIDRRIQEEMEVYTKARRRLSDFMDAAKRAGVPRKYRGEDYRHDIFI